MSVVASVPATRVASPLRWAGGKRWLRPIIEDLVNGCAIAAYHEPFLGGASVFLGLPQFSRAYLGDTNSELIETFRVVRDMPDDVAARVLQHENDRDTYYEVRASAPITKLERAARFIYLNHTSYNGIYRVNLTGVYNVPFGSRASPQIPTGDHLGNVSKRLKTATLRVGDFAACINGYANSARGETDLIPVVAFLDLPQTEQVKLFMQINENQQAVPKNLRNTLNADLLWASDDYTERARALRLKIAQDLGDQKTSPLYGRVIVGENQRTSVRCITIDAISNGLLRGNFIGTFTKTGAKTHGTFYGGDNKATAKTLIPFLEGAFGYLRDGLPTQWALGGSEGGFVFMNNGVEAFLRLLSDIVDHVKEHDEISPLSLPPGEVLDSCGYLLAPLVDHLESLSADDGLEYRKLYGSGGGTQYYRRLQRAVHDARPHFDPPDLTEWLKAQDKEFITAATTIVRDLEEFLKEDIRTRLQDEFGNDWNRLGIPRKILVERGKDAVEKNIDLPTDKQVTVWDCMYLVDYESILLQNHALWQKRFAKRYTKPGDEEKAGGWKAGASWLAQLNKVRNNVSHAQGVSEEDYAFLTELRDWLLLDKVDNEL